MIYPNAVQELFKMLGVWYRTPGKKDFKQGKSVRFIMDSHYAWAFEMIRSRVISSEKSVIDTLEDIRFEMDDYSCRAKTEDARLVFAVAYEVATDMLDDVILRKELRKEVGITDEL